MYITEIMNERHLGTVARIEQESFSEPWSPDALKNTLNNSDYRFYCLVDVENRTTLGYVGLVLSWGEGEIVSVAVDESCRGKGLGSLLLKEVLKREKETGTERLFLEVRKSNKAAIRLYEKTGFGVDGVRKNFYRKPVEDALLMSVGLV
ncbi:MAG: ribosomal protein S18-alanine N-acetyltransferase [Lachnospiraceae bacterium]